MYENLFNLIDDLQKATMKIKVQEVLNEMVKDERVREILDADVVMAYYEKMYKHFEEHPKDFLFPNREWLRESLDRLGVDLSNVFDKYANVDHIKREEVVTLFMLLWIHMVIQNPIRIEVIKDPYDLFYIWTKNRVFIARPTETHYLQDGDRRVLYRLGKSYGWFTGVHHFSIGLKGAIEYMYSSPDDITNINGDDLLEEKGRRHNIARNTKFIVREMTGYSNTSYKILLEDYYRTKFDITIDPYIKEIVDTLAEDYGVDLDSNFISYAKKNATAKPDSPFQTVAIIDIINAMIKLKEKLNEEKN